MRKQILSVVIVSLLSLALFWTPWLFKIERFYGIEFGGHGMEIIVTNFDGLQYLAIAKTGYLKEQIASQFAFLNNSPSYYSAHFPLYPLLIGIFDKFVSGPSALLISIITNNILLAIGIYLITSSIVKDRKKATLIALISLFVPGRMLSNRAVGASEPMFIFFSLSALYLMGKEKRWQSAMMAALATATRPIGILLSLAYLGDIFINKKPLRMALPQLLSPLVILVVFAWYYLRLGDFGAYFAGGSELHPIYFAPFMIFSNQEKWVSGIFREEFFYFFALYLAGTVKYLERLKEKESGHSYATWLYLLLYGLVLASTAHQDLARYSLPVAPIITATLLAPVERKYLKAGLLILATIATLLSWQFVVGNVQATADWSALL